MKVSVCMITYNHEKYIREAIEGVLMQETDFDFELIIANDNSKDATAEIISELIDQHPNGKKIKFFNHSENKGMMPNFIFTLQQCTGNYIALCDGDDYWTDRSKLQKQADFLDNNPEYVLTFHKVSVLRPNGKLCTDFLTRLPENHETLEDLAASWNYIHTPSVLFRNVITDFPYEFQITPIGDFFLYMMLAEKGKLKYCDDDMATYRYGIGIFSADSELKNIKSSLVLFSLLASYVKDEEIKKIILRRQLRSISILEDYLKHGIKASAKLKKNFFRVIKKIKRR